MPLLTFRKLDISVLSLALAAWMCWPAADHRAWSARAGLHTIPAPIPTCLPCARVAYTLVKVTPRVDQHDLLARIVEISIPSTANPTVAEMPFATSYFLLRSEFRLCTQAIDLATLARPGLGNDEDAKNAGGVFPPRRSGITDWIRRLTSSVATLPMSPVAPRPSPPSHDSPYTPPSLGRHSLRLLAPDCHGVGDCRGVRQRSFRAHSRDTPARRRQKGWKAV